MKAILTYHSIDDSGSVISVDAATFRAHVEALVRNNVSIVPLERLREVPDHANAVSLTFDDAFENFATAAWPVLRDHALPVTVFVVTEHMSKTNSWSAESAHVPQLPLLSWSEAERLAAEGVTIGSHTRTHPDLRTMSNEQLNDEIETAAQTITQRIGVPPVSFAYPYGSFDQRAADAAARLHSLACTTELRAVTRTDQSLLLPRLDAYYLRAPGLLERFGSTAFGRYLWLRAGGRRLRQALRGRSAR